MKRQILAWAAWLWLLFLASALGVEFVTKFFAPLYMLGGMIFAMALHERRKRSTTTEPPTESSPT